MAEDTKNLGEIINTFDAAAGEALGKREGHTPRIEAPKAVGADEPFEVKVSVQNHPNKVEHSIRWIEVYFREDGRAFNPIMLARVEFAPVSSEPEAKLKVRLSKSGSIMAMEYCNVHGLWSAKQDIKVE
ncbi:MAG TPA: class II SORL domain-containing protein [Methanothrix sp.]|nr:class II SORL domain-containing protein [Methanothrix sp.]HRW82475.1 class II SORL domain-containing protein [Methanothrix sp.]